MTKIVATLVAEHITAPRAPGSPRIVYPLGYLAPGEGFLVAGDIRRNRVDSAVSWYGKRNKKAFSVRRQQNGDLLVLRLC